MKSWTLVAAVAAVLGMVGSAPADAIVNGSFEVISPTDPFPGWTVSQPALSAVVTTHSLADGGVREATDGQHFALLTSGAGEGIYSMLSQSFAARTGDVLSFDAFFETRDYTPYNDHGFVSVFDATTEHRLFYWDVVLTGNYGSSGWRVGGFTFTYAGNFKIQAGVVNIEDNSGSSYLGLDHVKLDLSPSRTEQPPEGTVTTPLPAAAWAGTSLIAALGILRVARGRRQTTEGG